MHSTGKENFTVFVYYKTKKLPKQTNLKTAQTAASEKNSEVQEKETISFFSASKRKRNAKDQQTSSAFKDKKGSARLASSDKKVAGKNGRK